MTLLKQPAQTTFQLASHESEDKGFHPIHEVKATMEYFGDADQQILILDTRR